MAMLSHAALLNEINDGEASLLRSGTAGIYEMLQRRANIYVITAASKENEAVNTPK